MHFILHIDHVNKIIKNPELLILPTLQPPLDKPDLHALLYRLAEKVKKENEEIDFEYKKMFVYKNNWFGLLGKTILHEFIYIDLTYQFNQTLIDIIQNREISSYYSELDNLTNQLLTKVEQNYL
jgi:hypothetical protein